jgi:hypothetical protein
MAPCPVLCGIITHGACYGILNCDLNDHCNCLVLSQDSCGDLLVSYIFCFSLCWKEQEVENNYSTLVW